MHIPLALDNDVSKQLEEKLRTAFDEQLRFVDEKMYNFLIGLEEKCSKIPEDRLVKPPAYIIGPALETSKYYYEQDDLRNMFTNLIANLFDIQMYRAIHPAYIEIIKQLSPLDAKLLADFRPKTANYMYMGTPEIHYFDKDGKRIDENGNLLPEVERTPDFKMPKDLKPSYYTFPETIKPMVSYWLSRANERLLIQNNVIKTDVEDDVTSISASITNLERLGLIETSYGMGIIKESNYDFSLAHPFYLEWQEFNDTPNNVLTFRFVRGNMIAPGQYEKIDIQKGIARLTQFGYNFSSACVIEEAVVRA